MHNPATGERMCEVCKGPLKTSYVRYDTKTCSPKCRQQAYRNRRREEQEAHYAEAREARSKERERRDRYNANRKIARGKRRRARAKT